MGTKITGARLGWNSKVGYDLEVIDCPRCYVAFGVPAQWVRDARNDPRITLHCPAAHPIHWPGQTPEQRANAAEARATHLADQLEAERRSKAAIKGHLTRARKRGGAGVCPVEGCKRHFAQVERHIKSKHPGFLASLEGAQ